MTFQILLINQLFKTILNTVKVRVHAVIARYAWAKAWYLLRGFDVLGVGFVKIPLTSCCDFLNCGESTFYRYLNQGKKAGAFRYCRIQNGTLEVFLGSLLQICKNLRIHDFGATAEVPLTQVHATLRQVATQIATEKLQQQSHYAAVFNLKRNIRKTFKPPTADQIMEAAGRPSHETGKGDLPFVVYIGDKRVFVSASFAPFGASQKGIGKKLGISERTVRRHLVGRSRRQLMQAKAAYRQVKTAISHDADYHEVNSDMIVTSFQDTHALLERTRGGKNFRDLSYLRYVTVDSFDEYYKKCWLHCCNIYETRFKLCKMGALKRHLAAFFENLSEGPRKRRKRGGKPPTTGPG